MLRKKDKGKILFFRESVFKIAQLIFNFPHKTFHIRMLEKETGLSTTAIINSLEELEKYEIITIDKTPLTTNIKANIESQAYKFYKVIFNLFMLQREMLISSLAFTYRPETIVLFGSAAKGEDIEGSDIDLLLITSRKVVGLGKIIESTQKDLNRKINLHVIETIEKSAKEFKNAIANGIVLHGYLKVV